MLAIRAAALIILRLMKRLRRRSGAQAKPCVLNQSSARLKPSCAGSAR